MDRSRPPRTPRLPPLEAKGEKPVFFFFVVALLNVVDSFNLNIVWPLLPFMVDSYGVARTEEDLGAWVGAAGAAVCVGQLLSSYAWGALSDRIGRRPVMLMGMCNSTFSVLVFGTARTYAQCLAGRFLSGLLNGNAGVVKTYVGETTEKSQQTMAFSIFAMAFGFASCVSPAIGGFLQRPAERWPGVFGDTVFETFPYLLPCVIASVLSAGSLVLAYFKPPESIDVEAAEPTERVSWGRQFVDMTRTSVAMLGKPGIGAMIWVATLFILGFTIMHSVFILYTEMDAGSGGLGFSEQDNGRMFAMIGLLGIFTQGALIGPLTRRFGTRRLIPMSILLTGLGLTLIPYTQASMAWLQLFFVVTCIAIGNGVFQPSSSTYLTRLARKDGYDLGVVMGAQESLSAFARIFGPLGGGIVWELTVGRGFPWDYHTVFHVCGLLMVISAVLTLRIPRLPDINEAEITPSASEMN